MPYVNISHLIACGCAHLRPEKDVQHKTQENNKCFQMSEHKKTVERSSEDTFWGLCCYSSLEELQTSGYRYWFFSAYCDVYWCISSSFISPYGKIWWEYSIFFSSFSKIFSEWNRLKADEWIHHPLIWPTSQAMMSVSDFISQISSTSTWGPTTLFQTSYCKYWCALKSQRNYEQVFTWGRKRLTAETDFHR